MLPALLFASMLSLSPAPQPVDEPDGSRTLGIVPPYRAEPTPPAWLRTTSHNLAALDCRHYIYEAYADGKGQWLVRYVNLPEEGEAFREIEQAFLFTSDPKKKPTELKTTDVQYDTQAALWQKRFFTLVDRRDLMKPQ